MRTAWNTDEEVRRVLAPISCILSSSSRQDEDEDCLLLPASSIRSKRPSLKSSSTLKDALPLITSDPQTSAAVRTLAPVAKSTILVNLPSPPATRGKVCIYKSEEWEMVSI